MLYRHRGLLSRSRPGDPRVFSLLELWRGRKGYFLTPQRNVLLLLLKFTGFSQLLPPSTGSVHIIPAVGSRGVMLTGQQGHSRLVIARLESSLATAPSAPGSWRQQNRLEGQGSTLEPVAASLVPQQVPSWPAPVLFQQAPALVGLHSDNPLWEAGLVASRGPGSDGLDKAQSFFALLPWRGWAEEPGECF